MVDHVSYRPAPDSIPLDPGVYRFRDADGRVIYVGKAKNLRARLATYFQNLTQLHPRTAAMVRTAASVEWTVVATEVEALQLEYSWIKEFDPRFNIQYRDDKSYPWLAVTMGEKFPRVMVGRGAKKKGVRYFGPYSHAWAIRDTVDTLLRVFPMRSCSNGVFRRAQQVGRPCLLGYIDKCAAPCVGRISEADHRQMATELCDFMAGQTQALLSRIESDMYAAAEVQDFELAARRRDDLIALNKVLERQAVVFSDGTNADVIAIAHDELEVAVQVFHVRDGRIRGQRGWVAERVVELTPAELVGEFLLQLYGDETADGIPREVLVTELPPDAATYADLLGELRGTKVQLRVPQRGDKRLLAETVAENASQALALHKAKRAGDLTTRSKGLEELQAGLGLPAAPLRIECYDVSTLQGTQTVASMVVFEDGLPRKSQYRRFTIQDAEAQQDDLAAMYEVITRRFRRLLSEKLDSSELASGQIEADAGPQLIDPETGKARRFAYTPGLVVVDGGPAQVAVAQRALDDLGIDDIPVCGLAKRLEEVWLPGKSEPVIFSRSSQGLYLLQRLRDEAHRFAVSHHRSRRSQQMIDSVLDKVPGVGPARRQALLKHFGSLRKLQKATEAEIAQVPGIGAATAQAIMETLALEAAQRRAVNPKKTRKTGRV